MSSLSNDQTSDLEIDDAIAVWIRTGSVNEVITTSDLARVLLRIDLHGMGPNLALKNDPVKLPNDLAQALRHRLIGREMWEELHERVLFRALDILVDEGLNPILMKGTALAYSHYERRSVRVRGDTDILIEEGGRFRAFSALKNAGFQTPLTAGGDTVTSEALFYVTDATGLVHDLDLHWRLNSSPVIASLFDHAELLEHSEPVTHLHPKVMRLGDIDALLFAAVHRSLHINRPTKIYLNGAAFDVIDSLTWLRDIDVLFQALDTHARQQLVQCALQKGIGDILLDALQSAHSRLGTEMDNTVLVPLEKVEAGWIAQYIAASPAKAVMMNLTALPGLVAKREYVAELLFPSENYMRSKFVKGRFDWLPILYLRRLRQGLRKFLFDGRAAQ